MPKRIHTKLRTKRIPQALEQRHIADVDARIAQISTQDRVEKGTFSPEQISRLVTAVEGDWRGLVLAAFYTGARLSDLAHLEWKSADLVERSITFRQRKTDATVLVPMHPELESHLLSLPAPARGNAPVFPSLYGVPTGGTRGLSVGFSQIMERESAKIRERGHGISPTFPTRRWNRLFFARNRPPRRLNKGTLGQKSL